MTSTFDRSYTPIKGGIYAYSRDSTIPPCGGVPTPYIFLQRNAFYCPQSDFIAWDDEALFPELEKKYGTFLLAIVIAHEWGHAIQHRSDSRLYGVEAEQQADCFAGSWTSHLSDAGGKLADLRDKELDRALGGFIEIRDYVGMTSQDLGAHGSAFDRIRAFQEGYEGGASACAQYESGLPAQLIAVPYRNFKERFRSGNLPFDQVVPETQRSLSTFWKGQLGKDPIEITSGTSSCQNTTSPEGFSDKELSWCAEDNTIRYDTKRLKREYDNLGDLGAATPIAISWSQAQLARSGTSNSGKALYLDALCLAGAYTGSLYNPDAPETSILSPGDMDEAVQAMLAVSAPDKADNYGTAFEQVASFRRGVLGNASACAAIDSSVTDTTIGATPGPVSIPTLSVPEVSIPFQPPPNNLTAK
jgi:predicted metalloprotease